MPGNVVSSFKLKKLIKVRKVKICHFFFLSFSFFFTGNLFLKEISGFMLNVTHWRGRSCHPGHYICVFFLHESETQESWKTFFPPFPPLWLYFHLPDGGCALTFAGINLLVHLDFPSLICLNKINGHSCGQIYPKLELSLLGIPANRAHP